MRTELWMVAITVWLLASTTALSAAEFERQAWLAGILWFGFSLLSVWNVVSALDKVLP